MKGFVRFLAVFLIINVSNAVPDEYRTVNTNYGQVRGVRKTSLLKNVDFYSFRGIPYATAPTGELRFKAPEPADAWTPKVLDAFEYGNTCIRPNVFLIIDSLPQSEDCLFINIFVPADVKPDEKLAVMFWIHGGGFVEWNSNDNLFGPDFLIEQRVIVVTLNYRLGVFGFLSFGTAEYSGNMGLKDQQLALKWTYENIEQFNGDNQRITIFGESAGGAATHFQFLSTESKKYFNNAIMMSGTAISLFAMREEKDIVAIAYKIARDLGGPSESTEDLIKFFKTVPAEKIVKYGEPKGDHRMMTREAAPIIERKDAKKPFLVEPPLDVYKTSNMDIDVIFYHTNAEMLVFFDMYMKYFDVWDMETDFGIELPFDGFNFKSFGTEEHRLLSKEIREFYFGNASINEKTKPQYLDMLNDAYFIYPIHKSMKTHLKHSKARTFYIQFSVDSSLNLMKQLLNNTGTPGAGHCDELSYLFRSSIFQNFYDEVLGSKESKKSKISIQSIEYITRLFSNFAKYGEPTYEDDMIAGFGPIQNDEFNMLDITNEGLKLGRDQRKKANDFWTRLDDKSQQMLKSRTKK